MKRIFRSLRLLHRGPFESAKSLLISRIDLHRVAAAVHCKFEFFFTLPLQKFRSQYLEILAMSNQSYANIERQLGRTDLLFSLLAM